jgi:hypothetical protein
VSLLQRHGWHVIAELTLLAVVAVFSVIYVTALVRGRVRAVPCPACGRLTSRAHGTCPRCGRTLAG